MLLTGIVGAYALIISIYLIAKKDRAEIRYIDKSGIFKNPPTFIETWHNKTLNLSFGDIKIIISHLTINETLSIIPRIAGNFAILKNGLDKFYQVPFSQEQKIHSYQKAYKANIDLLYALAKPHNKAFNFKNKFYKKAMADTEFILKLSSEIFDYWQYMGKLLGALMKGATPLILYGEPLTSDLLKWDTEGNRLIEPRYGSSFQLLSKGQLKAKALGSSQINKGDLTPVEGSKWQTK